MAARSKTDTCCLTLPLRLEKWQADRLAKRFHIAEQIYNAMLLSWIKKLRVVEQMPEYRAIQSQLQKLYEEDKQKTDAAKKLFSRRKEILKKNGFSEYSFKTGIRKYYAHFKENIASNVATHCIASQVWDAFSKKLFGNGGRLHFKRAGDIHSLRGYSKSGESGGVEIIFRGTYIEWNGLRLPLKLDPQNPYEAEMLAKRVKYVRILRTPGKSIDHWYAQLALEGKPTVKRNAATVARSALTLALERLPMYLKTRSVFENWLIKWRTSSATSDGFSESWIEVDGRQIPITMRRMVR